MALTALGEDGAYSGGGTAHILSLFSTSCPNNLMRLIILYLLQTSNVAERAQPGLFVHLHGDGGNETKHQLHPEQQQLRGEGMTVTTATLLL